MTAYCTECGAILQPGKKFCSNCGAKVETIEAEPGNMQAPPSGSQAFGQAPPTGQQAFGQTPPTGQPAFGQTPPPAQQAFGQTPPPAQPAFGRTPSSGPQALGQAPTPGSQAFGQAPPSGSQAFGQSPPSAQQGPLKPISTPPPFSPQRPAAASGQTMALYDQDLPPGQQINRPDQRADFAPKRQAVYPQQDMNVQYPPRPSPYAPPAVPAMPQAGGAPMSMVNYTLYLLIMSIPIAGLVMSVIWGVTNPAPPERSNLAKAMIVFNVIWGAVIIFFLYQFYHILSQLADISVKFGF